MARDAGDASADMVDHVVDIAFGQNRGSNYVFRDRGSLTLTFPGQSEMLKLWRSSSEFCAVKSVTMVSLAQHKITLSHSYSTASNALATFYTRQFAEKFRYIKPPLLQSEHVRMVSRSLFHCAASRAIPHSLRIIKSDDASKSNDGAVNVSEDISLDSNNDNSEMVVNNDRSKDYTIPAVVQMNPQPSILGQQPPSEGLQYNPGQYMPGLEGYAVPLGLAGRALGPPAGPQSMSM
nr:transducin/WD40 repeat-like superfamily protein [Tanacetum cinerariifolium]